MYNRRQFLKYSFLGLGGLYCGGASLYHKSSGLILAPTLPGQGVAQLIVLDCSLKTISEIEIPLRLSHATIGNPANRRRVVVLEKWGTLGCEVDVLEKKVVRSIKASRNHEFEGHGAFSYDGSLFYTAESDTQNNNSGSIIIRAADSMKEIGRIPSFGAHPHDLKISENGETLIVSNVGGGKDIPCISYVDVSTEKLIAKINLDNKKMRPEHFTLLNGSNIFIGYTSGGRIKNPQADLLYEKFKNPKTSEQKETATRLYSKIFEYFPAPVAIAYSQNSPQILLGPEKTYNNMKHTLSLATNSTNSIVGVTHPSGNTITFWSTEQNLLLKELNIRPTPLGIAYDDKSNSFVVSTGNNQFYFIDEIELKIWARQKIYTSSLMSAHLLSWYTATGRGIL